MCLEDEPHLNHISLIVLLDAGSVSSLLLSLWWAAFIPWATSCSMTANSQPKNGTVNCS